MGKQAPKPVDYTGIANQQAQIGTQAVNQQTHQNRPDQVTNFGSTSWTIGPNGQPVQTTSLAGPLGGAASGLQQQFADLAKNPLDLSGLPQVDYGDTARQQAFDATYNQMAGRINPEFQQRTDALETQLANQGLDPGSEAGRRALREMRTAQGDALAQARGQAFGQGLQAQQQAFGQSMQARQNALAEALRQRGLPLQEMAALQGMTQMPSFMGAGMAPTPELLQAAGMSQADAWRLLESQQQQMGDIFGGLGQLGGSLGGLFALSDARAKRAIRRHPLEVLPGIALASWEYRHQPGTRHVGVIAQDVLRVMPQAVAVGEDGLLRVNYGLLMRRARPSIMSMLSSAGGFRVMEAVCT